MEMTDAELGLTIKQEADQVLFEDLHFGSRLKDVVRARLGAERPSRASGKRRLAWLWPLAATAVMGALAIGLWPRVAGEVGLGYYPPGVSLAPALEARTKDVQPQTRRSNAPGSRPFSPGFEAAADPYPVRQGQTVSLGSAAGWPGRHVWLYAAPVEDQRTIMDDRLLPRDAILIGRAGIDAEGRWTFDWTVPDRLSRGDLTLPVAEGLGDYRQNIIHLIGVTDTGYLAARGLEIGPPRSVAVEPEKLTAGTKMKVTGSGYTPGTVLRLDLTHDTPDGGTDLQANIGRATVGPDGRFSFEYTIPQQLNWPFANNSGEMIDHLLTIGTPGPYELLIVENHPGQGPGPLLLKRLNIQTTP
ncbi:MAG: hypothetical protein ACYC41_04970 [Bacillota bacterium]